MNSINTKESKKNKIVFLVTENIENIRLANFLKNNKNLSAKAIRRLKAHGVVLINSKEALMKDSVKKGDVIELYYPHEKISEYLKPEPIPLDIIYEDDYVLVIEKPAGICVHPNKNHPDGTLANGVLYHLEKQGINSTIHFVNRLDIDTSGIILLAKNNYSAQQFYHQQKKSQIKRRYHGLVWGILPKDSGTISLPLIKEEGRTTRRCVHQNGKEAITKYRVLKRYSKCTYLELILETGRTHQIRAHLAYLGYPLVGDGVYNFKEIDIEIDQQVDMLKRQFLHAYHISFYHPHTYEEMIYTSPLPVDLQKVLNHL